MWLSLFHHSSTELYSAGMEMPLTVWPVMWMFLQDSKDECLPSHLCTEMGAVSGAASCDIALFLRLLGKMRL